MKILLLYFLTIFLSNTIGALSGMGGGVIIKPLLDLIDYHSLTSISFYSSIAVFTMSISSTYKQYQNGISVDFKKAAGISFGSLIGGVVGDRLLDFAINLVSSQETVQIIQYLIMLVTLVLVLVYQHYSNFYLSLSSVWAFILLGIGLGIYSTFLGIGGGPINVACLMFCFGMDIKVATVYSIITIFFSQLAKLITLAGTVGFASFDLKLLWAIIPAALLGGYIGGLLSKHLTQKQLTKIYSMVVLLVILLNVYNLWGAIS